MRKTIQLAGLVVALALSGCDLITSATGHVPVSVNFDPKVLVQEAVVRLCGRDTRLRQHGNSFRGFVRVDCEGSGKVRVLFADARISDCHIGYVTPGLSVAEDFVLQGHICRTEYQAENEFFAFKSPASARSVVVRVRYIATPIEHLETTVFAGQTMVAKSSDDLQWHVAWRPDDTATFCHSGTITPTMPPTDANASWIVLEADCKSLGPTAGS